MKTHFHNNVLMRKTGKENSKIAANVKEVNKKSRHNKTTVSTATGQDGWVLKRLPYGAALVGSGKRMFSFIS